MLTFTASHGPTWYAQWRVRNHCVRIPTRLLNKMELCFYEFCSTTFSATHGIQFGQVLQIKRGFEPYTGLAKRYSRQLRMHDWLMTTTLSFDYGAAQAMDRIFCPFASLLQSRVWDMFSIWLASENCHEVISVFLKMSHGHQSLLACVQ
jgi:hypothetical protein